MAGGINSWPSLDKVSIVHKGITYEGDTLTTDRKLEGCAKACFSYDVQDGCAHHHPDLWACAVALPDARDGNCPQVGSHAYVGVSE